MMRWPVWGLVLCLFSAGLGAADVAAAEAELRRIEALVEAGAAPKAAREAARRRVRDARLQQFLQDTLFAGSVTPDQVPEMLRAAAELRDRAAENLARQQRLVAEGVQPANSLDRWREDLAQAERQLGLARSRARLIEELAEMARREAELAAEAEPRLARFEGKGTLTEQDLSYIESAFYAEFSKPLPVSARGATAVHRSLGFDHRDRFDVALNPDHEEGRWLIGFLERLGVPYIAYRKAVAGKSTGAHVHLGLPSPRLF